MNYWGWKSLWAKIFGPHEVGNYAATRLHFLLEGLHDRFLVVFDGIYCEGGWYNESSMWL